MSHSSSSCGSMKHLSLSSTGACMLVSCPSGAGFRSRGRGGGGGGRGFGRSGANSFPVGRFWSSSCDIIASNMAMPCHDTCQCFLHYCLISLVWPCYMQCASPIISHRSLRIFFWDTTGCTYLASRRSEAFCVCSTTHSIVHQSCR